tara:strand:+ start:212 stop:715 length:504 start_codon:yes stop_codon:yes gene_type:complete
MKEIFKDIKGYEGLYQVSNLGNVKSLKRKHVTKDKLLSPCMANNGYLKVNLTKNGIYKNNSIHQLIAITFLNHVPNGRNIIVDHIDNNPLNNNLENLQLITQRENVSKDRVNCSSRYTGVCWHKSLNKWVSSITINGKRKHLGYFNTEIEASNEYQKALKNHLQTNK